MKSLKVLHLELFKFGDELFKFRGGKISESRSNLGANEPKWAHCLAFNVLWEYVTFRVPMVHFDYLINPFNLLSNLKKKWTISVPNLTKRDQEITLKEFLKFVKNLSIELSTKFDREKTKLLVFRKCTTFEM